MPSFLCQVGDQPLDESVNVQAAGAKGRGLSARSRALVRSMVIRQQYGGMVGDVSAMAAMAAVWAARFDADAERWHAVINQLAYGRSTPDTTNIDHNEHAVRHGVVQQRESNGAACDSPVEDRSCTLGMRQTEGPAMRTTQSSISVLPLYKQDVAALAKGVDFHCCSWMTREVIRSLEARNNGVLPAVLQGNSSAEGTEAMVKRAIWDHRSGVNGRRHVREFSLSPSTNSHLDGSSEVRDDASALLALPTLGDCLAIAQSSPKLVHCGSDNGGDAQWRLLEPLVENVAMNVVNKGLSSVHATSPVVVDSIFGTVPPTAPPLPVGQQDIVS
jgi:hypothetical protein